jgi:hypothetical protein
MVCPCCISDTCLNDPRISNCTYTISVHTGFISFTSGGIVAATNGTQLGQQLSPLAARIAYETGFASYYDTISDQISSGTYQSFMIAGVWSICPSSLPVVFPYSPAADSPYRTNSASQGCDASQDSGDEPTNKFHIFAYLQSDHHFRYSGGLFGPLPKRGVLWLISIGEDGTPTASVAWDGFVGPLSGVWLRSPGAPQTLRCLPCNYPGAGFSDPPDIEGPFGVCPPDLTSMSVSLSISCPP